LLEKEFNKVKSIEEPLVKKVNNDFSDKWDFYKNKFYNYETFGFLLDIMIRIINSEKVNEEKFVECKKEINNYLLKEKISLDKYFKLFEVDEERASYIRYLLNELLKK